MKRFLSLILAVIMVLSVACLPAFAAEENFTVDGTTIRIFNQAGWNEAFTTYNVEGNTIYVECDIEITARISELKASLIGKKGENNEKPVITLDGVSWFQNFKTANITLSNFIIESKNDATLDFTSASYHGIIAQTVSANDIQVSNIINNVSATAGSSAYSLGLIGSTNKSNLVIQDCVNNGTFAIPSKAETNTMSHAGAFLGILRSNNDSPTIIRCTNNGDISAVVAAGGILGGSAKDTATATIISCINTGAVTSTNRFAGGIIGYNKGAVEISKCTNLGKISANEYFAGGIAGCFNGSIDQSYNSGEVTAVRFIGGIIGGQNSSDIPLQSISITNSYNDGKIYATEQSAGGIGYYIGNNTQDASVNQNLSSVYNVGEVTTGNGKHAYQITRGASKGNGGTVVVNNVYALESGKISILEYGNESTETINYSALNANTEAGFEMLPPEFDDDLWLSSEDGYPILKNNLPKNADGTDKEYYKVTLANGENGVALKEEVTYVEKGTDKTYTLKINPNEGYKVESVTANGTSCEGTNNVYEIPVNADITVTVTYSLKPVEEGTISASHLFTSVDADQYEVYAFASYSIVPNNYAVDFGILLSFEDTNDFTLANTSLRKFSANIGENVKGANEKGQYGIKLYGNLITSDKTYYCVPYVEYADGTACYGSVMTIE